MIQKFNLIIKRFLDKNNFDFKTPVTLDDFQALETFCLNNLSLSVFHSHDRSICKSPNFHYVQSYNRYYIYYHNNEVIIHQCKIPVIYCENCKSYQMCIRDRNEA